MMKNYVAIKTGIRESLQSKRPVAGNGHRLALFLSCARRKAKSPREVAQAFQRGLDRWKIFEKKTAAYHLEKFFFSRFHDEGKSAQATIEDFSPNRKAGYKKRRMGKSDHKTSEDGDDDNDPSTPNGGVAHA